MIEDIGKKRALIIAISNYDDKNLIQLPFCKNDGLQMSELLKSLDYEIKDEHNLVGKVDKDQIETAIDTFFTNENIRRKDLLLFYYSGHCIPESSGEHYLASTKIDPFHPWRGGYSFNELSEMIDRSSSERKVVILDCCYSGSADLGKGTDNASVEAGMEAVDKKIKSGYGKCILAACRGTQESFGRTENDNSQFTYYLLEGLRGNRESVDEFGNVTPEKLSNFVIDRLDALPPDKRPQQRPIRKIEASGDIILVSYPNLAWGENENVNTTTIKKENILGIIPYVFRARSGNQDRNILPYALIFTTSRLIAGFTGGAASTKDPTKWNIKAGFFKSHPLERANQFRTMSPDDIFQSDETNLSIWNHKINSISMKKARILNSGSIEIMTDQNVFRYFFPKKQFDEYVEIVKAIFPDRLKIL